MMEMQFLLLELGKKRKAKHSSSDVCGANRFITYNRFGNMSAAQFDKESRDSQLYVMMQILYQVKIYLER